MDSNETTAKSGDISQSIFIGTCIMIALSILVMVINFNIFIIIGKYYPTTATYKIQRIDSLIMCISQMGTIGQFLGSIDKFQNKFLCTIATGTCMVAILQPTVSFLFLSIIPFLKKWTFMKNQHSLKDKSIMYYYGIITSVVVLYLFMMAIINHHQELHIIPTYENCIRSQIHASPTKMFLYFILPILIAFFVTLLFDSNIWQLPYSHVKDIYSAIFAQTSIKSSVLTFLILMWVLITFLTKWLQLSVNGSALMGHSFVLTLLIVKGPYILSWTFQTDVKNLEEAKHNYMVLRFGPKNKSLKMEESVA